jgi:hypothetical protein
VRENRTPGSVRGLSGNWQSYRDQLLTRRLTSQPVLPLDDMLIAFNLVGSIGIYITALEALPRVFSQEIGFTLRGITVDRLSHSALSTRDDKIPSVRLADC